MTLRIDLPPDKEAALKAQAKAAGVSAEDFALQTLERELAAMPVPESIAHLQRMNPEKWARQFREWADSHRRDTPLLSDEAISRESIYPDGV